MKERIRNFFLKNWTLKLTALGLVFFLWLIVRGDPGAERIMTVPLQVTVPRNMEVTNERPASVDVTVRGTITNMWFGQNIITCNIDLQSADEGPHPVPLSAANIQMPRTTGLEVIAVRPARVLIVLERTTNKEVDVRASLGETPPGLDIYSVSVFPPRVVITGPRKHVEAVGEVPTEKVSLTGARESFRTWVNLNITDSVVHTPAGPVEVGIDLGPRRTSHTVRQIPVLVDDESVTVTPPRISVQILAPPALAESLKPEDFVATIPGPVLDGFKGSVRVKPTVRLKEPRGQSVLIRTVPEVLVRRTGKAETGNTHRSPALTPSVRTGNGSRHNSRGQLETPRSEFSAAGTV